MSLIILTIAGYLAWNKTETICKYRDGKWASTTAQCITRNCYKNNSCGTWANPAYRCNKLNIGDNISEVYFQLGSPESVTGNTHYWFAHKASNIKIKAVIENNKLMALNCNGT